MTVDNDVTIIVQPSTTKIIEKVIVITPDKPVKLLKSVRWCGYRFFDREALLEMHGWGPKKWKKLIRRYPGLLKLPKTSDLAPIKLKPHEKKWK